MYYFLILSRSDNHIGSLLELTEAFVPVLESSARAAAPLATMARIRAALDTLHHVTKVGFQARSDLFK